MSRLTSRPNLASIMVYCKCAGRSSLRHSCTANWTRGSRKNCTFRTKRTSAAFVRCKCSSFCCSSGLEYSLGAAAANSASRASSVRSRTLCMLDRTLVVACASGNALDGTPSGDTQDLVDWRLSPAATTASRSLATVKAANMSPVPLKKQSSAGTSTRNRRGDPSDRVVDPITVKKFSGGLGLEPDWDSLKS